MHQEALLRFWTTFWIGTDDTERTIKMHAVDKTDFIEKLILDSKQITKLEGYFFLKYYLF